MVLLDIIYYRERGEVKYLRGGKGIKALSSKFWINFVDQPDLLEREPGLVEREQNKSKLAEMWSGLHSSNLQKESSQEHGVFPRRGKKYSLGSAV